MLGVFVRSSLFGYLCGQPSLLWLPGGGLGRGLVKQIELLFYWCAWSHSQPPLCYLWLAITCSWISFSSHFFYFFILLNLLWYYRSVPPVCYINKSFTTFRTHLLSWCRWFHQWAHFEHGVLVYFAFVSNACAWSLSFLCWWYLNWYGVRMWVLVSKSFSL